MYFDLRPHELVVSEALSGYFLLCFSADQPLVG